jgi:hypothetical protein
MMDATTGQYIGPDEQILITQEDKEHINLVDNTSAPRFLTSSEVTNPSLNSTEDIYLQLPVNIDNVVELPDSIDDYVADNTEIAFNSLAIIGNNNNAIADNSHDDTVLLACSNVIAEGNDNLVIAAMKHQESDGIFTGFTEAFITRNLFALSQVHIGSMPDEMQEDVALNINGNVVINGTLHAKHIADEELYLEGNNSTKAITYNLLPEDGYTIVYINSTEGPVNIILGTLINNKFERNRRILFKDVSLEYHSLGSMYNINIIVPHHNAMINAPRIEYYNGTKLTVGVNAGYAINSAGGGVTLRYYINFNNIGTWVIESQFIGNARVK